jgi:hypothetical protein
LFEYLPASERSLLTTLQSLRQFLVADSAGAPVDNDGGPIVSYIRRFVRN